IMTATRRAYVQVRCAVVALWSERNQLYASQTRPGKSNLTQNSGFAGCSFLAPIPNPSPGSPRPTGSSRSPAWEWVAIDHHPVTGQARTTGAVMDLMSGVGRHWCFEVAVTRARRPL